MVKGTTANLFKATIEVGPREEVHSVLLRSDRSRHELGINVIVKELLKRTTQEVST